jgi:hypothetical protein
MMIKTNTLGQKTASFSFNKKNAIRIIVASLLSAAVITYYFFFKDRGPDAYQLPISLYVIMLAPAATALYHLYLDMPVVMFTEDKFLYEPKEGIISDGYWRDVEQILERPISGEVHIIMKGAEENLDKRKKTTIPAQKLALKGENLAAIAQVFHEAALKRLADNRPK